jgi:multisubunit Na+/H+ antiporter MnhC subunit
MVEECSGDSLPSGLTGRGLRRQLARLELVIAIVPAAVIGALLLTAPNTTGPMHGDAGPLPQIVIGVGILAYVVGLAMMIRIYRSDPEAHPSNWRSRGSLPSGMTGRGLRGRQLARFELVIAIVPGALYGALLLIAPNPMGRPMFVEDPLPQVVIGVAILAYVVGLAMMIRIYRRDAEDHPSNWRSRRF